MIRTLVRFYEPEGWLNELSGLKAKPRQVRLCKVQVRHPFVLAFSTSVAASYAVGSHAATEVHELLWFCGNATPETTADIERGVEERLAYLEQRLQVMGIETAAGRFLTELEAAI